MKFPFGYIYAKMALGGEDETRGCVFIFGSFSFLKEYELETRLRIDPVDLNRTQNSSFSHNKFKETFQNVSREVN